MVTILCEHSMMQKLVESLSRTSEMNVTLYVNYTNKKVQILNFICDISTDIKNKTDLMRILLRMTKKEKCKILKSVIL